MFEAPVCPFMCFGGSVAYAGRTGSLAVNARMLLQTSQKLPTLDLSLIYNGHKCKAYMQRYIHACILNLFPFVKIKCETNWCDKFPYSFPTDLKQKIHI